MEPEREAFIRENLPKAAEQGQLWLSFQPLRDINTKSLQGFETLMRWTHPTEGFIPPNEFIPEAERSGEIDNLGNWAINESLDRISQWKEARPDVDLTINVNVAPGQLHDPSFAKSVIGAVKDRGLSASNLTLEFTNSVSVTDVAAVRNIGELNRFGVRFAADDIGSEVFPEVAMSDPRFASIISEVKIDRSVASKVEQDPGRVKDIVESAHAMNAFVTAEGIETDEQLQALAGLGVDIGQGFHPELGRPVPFGQANELVMNEPVHEITADQSAARDSGRSL